MTPTPPTHQPQTFRPVASVLPAVGHAMSSTGASFRAALLGAIVGGLFALAGAYLTSRSASRLARRQASREAAADLLPVAWDVFTNSISLVRRFDKGLPTKDRRDAEFFTAATRKAEWTLVPNLMSRDLRDRWTTLRRTLDVVQDVPARSLSGMAINARADELKRQAQNVWDSLAAHIQGAQLPVVRPLVTDVERLSPARKPGEFNSPSGRG